jgi:hypothetical protein
MRRFGTLLLLLLSAGISLAQAQVGTQLVVTVTFADRVRPAGGSYYIPFNTNDALLLGPQSDSSHWQQYVVYRGGRFFFGTVPDAPFRPFAFETLRPPQPFTSGQVLADGRTLRVQVALSALQTGPVLPTRVKVNIVTVDDALRPIDALGRGADDRFGFVTLNLLRETYAAFSDPARDAREPAFDIIGGDVQVATP